MPASRSRSPRRYLQPTPIELEARRLLTIAATWGGQQASADYVGPQAGFGPDDIADDVINLPNGLPGGTAPNSPKPNPIKIVVTDNAFPTGAWEFATSDYTGTPDGYAPAYYDFTSQTLDINPTITVKNLAGYAALDPTANPTYTTRTIGNGDGLTIRVYDSTGALLDQSGTITATNPSGLPPATATAPAINASGPAESGWSQNNTTNLGWVHFTLATPASPINTLLLTDPAGNTWQSNYISAPSPPVHPLLFAAIANTNLTDVSFPPLRNETGAALSLRVTYANGASPTYTTVAGGYSDPILTGPSIAGGVTNLQPATGGASDLANLQAALNNYSYGTIVLGSPGGSAQFTLDAPLVISRPVTIVGAPGAVVQVNFATDANSPASWPNAIDIQADNVTLANLRLNIGANIPWQLVTPDGTASYSPQAIGSSTRGNEAKFYYNGQGSQSAIAKTYIVGLAIDDVTLVGPPKPTHPGDQSPGSRGEYFAPGGSTAPYALYTPLDAIDLLDVYGGRIVGNKFRGGAVLIQGGPWTIEDNDFQGAVSGTVNLTAINVRYFAFDLIVKGNHIHQVEDSGAQVGRTYEFLILSGTDNSKVYNATIASNAIDGGIGLLPQDRSADGSGGMGFGPDNHPEVTLFECYNDLFVGKPLLVADSTTYNTPTLAGRVLVIPQTSFTKAGIQPGDVVSVLSGRAPGHTADKDGTNQPTPNATGDWAQVVQVLASASGQIALLLDRALPTDPSPQYGYDISINRGIVGLNFVGNKVDISSTLSFGLVLTGNDYGTVITGNYFNGGNVLEVDGNKILQAGAPFQIRATSSNTNEGTSGGFGVETYTLSLGTILSGNVINNAISGGSIATLNANGPMAVADRTFITASVANNVWQWSDSFLTSDAFYTDAKQSPVAYPTALNGFPILNTLTVGSFNTGITNYDADPRDGNSYRLGVSPTTTQTPDANGYDVGPAGYVDPVSLVVDLQGNSARFFDANNNIDPTYLQTSKANPPVARFVSGTVNSYRQLGPGVVTNPYQISAATASISSGGSSDSSAYYTTSGGTDHTYSTTQPIDTSGVANPLPQSVYQNQRFVDNGGTITYTIPHLNAGLPYLVRLDFAEIYFNGPGQRVFSLTINGVQKPQIDVYQAAGAKNKAIALYYESIQPDSSGNIVISLGAITNNPTVQGINVVPMQAVDVGQDNTDHALPGSSGPDGIIDEHLVLTGLRPDKLIDSIAIKPNGGGGVYYYRPNSPNAGSSTLLYLPHVGPGGTITADLYFDTNVRELGQVLPGLNRSEYEIDINYSGDSTTRLLYTEGILSDPTLPIQPLRQTSLSTATSDYDADGHSDFAIYDPTTQKIYSLVSGSVSIGDFTYFNSASAVGAGNQPIGSSDHLIPLNGDYDGDGKTDLGVYDQTTATFYLFLSGSGNRTTLVQQFGKASDNPTPVCGDYDGDERTDFAIFDPVTRSFYVLLASNVFTGTSAGAARTFQIDNLLTNAANSPVTTNPGTDVFTALDGDYDGDGKTDLGVYDETTAAFFILCSSVANLTSFNGAQPPLSTAQVLNLRLVKQFGAAGDNPLPVCADYDGDGRTDFAVYDQTANGNTGFYVVSSRDASYQITYQGVPADNEIPLVFDYNGDGLTDYGIYDPATGQAEFYLLYFTQQLGYTPDNPFPVSGYLNYALYRKLHPGNRY